MIEREALIIRHLDVRYCGILGQGQRLSPRFLYYKTESDLFKCVLTMPDNCPIRDDLPVRIFSEMNTPVVIEWNP